VFADVDDDENWGPYVLVELAPYISYSIFFHASCLVLSHLGACFAYVEMYCALKIGI
jgi:hypothetical protein